MIAALFALTVSALIVVVILVVFVLRFIADVAVRFHGNAELIQAMSDAWRTDFVEALRASEQANRAERALLLRAVLSRNGAEFGQLDRIRQQEHPVTQGSVSLSPEEYARWIEDDLRKMIDGETDPELPLVPEGMGG